MSSFVAHAATGAAIFFARHPWRERPARWALPVLVFLAMCPDLDYLPRWLWGAQPETRITHSLLFCVMAGVLTWLLCTPARRRTPGAVTLVMMVLASTSHLLLDTLVGAHSEPLLWPFSVHEVLSPVSLLPSAGHLRWGNVYLWRNLLIECGALGPVLAAAVAWGRGQAPWQWPLKAWGVLPLWMAFMAMSLAIH